MGNSKSRRTVRVYGAHTGDMRVLPSDLAPELQLAERAVLSRLFSFEKSSSASVHVSPVPLALIGWSMGEPITSSLFTRTWAALRTLIARGMVEFATPRLLEPGTAINPKLRRWRGARATIDRNHLPAGGGPAWMTAPDGLLYNWVTRIDLNDRAPDGWARGACDLYEWRNGPHDSKERGHLLKPTAGAMLLDPPKFQQFCAEIDGPKLVHSYTVQGREIHFGLWLYALTDKGAEVARRETLPQVWERVIVQTVDASNQEALITVDGRVARLQGATLRWILALKKAGLSGLKARAPGLSHGGDIYEKLPSWLKAYVSRPLERTSGGYQWHDPLRFPS